MFHDRRRPAQIEESLRWQESSVCAEIDNCEGASAIQSSQEMKSDLAAAF